MPYSIFLRIEVDPSTVYDILFRRGSRLIRSSRIQTAPDSPNCTAHEASNKAVLELGSEHFQSIAVFRTSIAWVSDIPHVEQIDFRLVHYSRLSRLQIAST